MIFLAPAILDDVVSRTKLFLHLLLGQIGLEQQFPVFLQYRHGDIMLFLIEQQVDIRGIQAEVEPLQLIQLGISFEFDIGPAHLLAKIHQRPEHLGNLRGAGFHRF